MSTPFKMNGFSGFGNEDKRILRKSNRKLIKGQREKFRKGEITKEQFKAAKKEIKNYTDIDVAKEHLKMEGSQMKFWPWGKRTKTDTFERGKGGEKTVNIQYPSGEKKKEKNIVYGKYGQKISKTITKYTKGGEVKKQRTKKYNQKRWE